MPSLILDHHNRFDLQQRMTDETWVVACLCAAWCGTCGQYQKPFAQLAERFPDTVFVWIDIEDEADVVGDLDVDNFPTLLIQRGDVVVFFGTMLPDTQLAERLIQSLQAQSPDQLRHHATSSPERHAWQHHCNLRQLLADA